MSSGHITEALSRIEHKLDLVLEMLSAVSGSNLKLWELKPVGDKGHECPLCDEPVSYQVDLTHKVITRKCGCKTGKQPPIDLGLFAPPAINRRMEGNDGSEVNEAGTDGSGAGKRRGAGGNRSTARAGKVPGRKR